MGQTVTIRENLSDYLAELKQWLAETEVQKLEEMGDFFKTRLESYEEHMSSWKDAYRRMEELLPPEVTVLLDLGCGTGLELDQILERRPGLSVTGIDLSQPMLDRLQEKHPGVSVICADYFQYPLGEEAYDAVISFESLHHFKPEQKRGLFTKIYRALRIGGLFLEADYIACCEEEESLLMATAKRKRQRDGISDGTFVHFDTPLTASHELGLLASAGFQKPWLAEAIEGASFILAVK